MRDHVRFLLDGEVQTVGGFDPTLTVLEYLRGDLRRCGTKEGCAEGDCGACTVVVAEPSPPGNGAAPLRYRAVNSCIQLLGALDGKQLITVEDLARGDDLHPVQEALVEEHGSQCGFCTPGFVMMLFAAWHEGAGSGRQAIDDQLAGNLCRCTGYVPIVRAARRVLARPAEDAFSAGAVETRARLEAIAAQDTLAVEHRGRRYFAPHTADALARLYAAHPQATVVAGATDVGLWVTKQHRVLDTVIYVGNVRDLATLEVHPDRIDVGATATYTDAWPVLAEHYPDFGELLRRLGATQVRNAGTLGGNVANGSPIGDTPPVLIALGATLHLRHGDARRSLPIEDFFLDYGRQDRVPGEFVERITVPRLGQREHLRTYKVSKRFDQDISALCGAFWLRLDAAGVVEQARLAYGGMAGVPKRAPGAERALTGKVLSASSAAEAAAALAEDFQPLSDWRASARYRSLVAGNLLRRLALELGDAEVATRLVGDREASHA